MIHDISLELYVFVIQTFVQMFPPLLMTTCGEYIIHVKNK